MEVAPTGQPAAHTGTDVTLPAVGGMPRGKTVMSKQGITPVLQFWKAFDLDSKRVILDTQGGTMKTEKDNSLRSRKKLAETTKTFRKLNDTEKVAGIGTLLRAYQEEIDNLTRRAKFSENAFFTLYKGLYAAPDPVPALEAINDQRTHELDEDNKRLKRELREYEAEFASLKNQDITIRKLEEQLSTLEREMDDQVHQQAELKCQELERQLTAKAQEFTQQKLDYERQLENNRSELREAYSRLDAMQSDLFAHKQRNGLAKNAFDAELEVISQEALLMQTLQLENTQLKKQLDDLLSISTESFNSTKEGSLENVTSLSFSSSNHARDLAEKEAMIVNLRQEVFRLKETLTTANTTAASELATLKESINQIKRDRDELAKQLDARPSMESYNDILHQLRVLKQLEYNIIDEEDEAQPSNDAELDGVSAPSDVEKILVSRVRRLEHSLQQREIVVQQRTAELQKLQQELEHQREVVRDQAALVRTLEESVAALESRKAMNVGSVNDVGAEILMGAVEGAANSGASTTNIHAAGVLSNSDNKMLEIVRGQRDRFRDRMKELQAEKNRMEELVNTYKSSVARLENDNMQLYHKIRYLQSYRATGGTPAHRIMPSHNDAIHNHLEAGGGGSADVEAKYKSMYEEKMNPFVQFNKMESQQRYTNLNTVDKILLNSARLFLGHRITRNIAFSYILLLHFLVVATLYSFMHGCGISNE